MLTQQGNTNLASFQLKALPLLVPKLAQVIRSDIAPGYSYNRSSWTSRNDGRHYNYSGNDDWKWYHSLGSQDVLFFQLR